MRLLKQFFIVIAVLCIPLLAIAAPETSGDDPTVGDEPSATDGGEIMNADKYLQFDPADNSTAEVEYATSTYLTFLTGAGNPASISFNLINVALGFLGMLSMFMIAYAGYMWFRGGENEENVQKAKDIIKGALIGLAIALMSLGLSYYVFGLIQAATVVA